VKVTLGNKELVEWPIKAVEWTASQSPCRGQGAMNGQNMCFIRMGDPSTGLNEKINDCLVAQINKAQPSHGKVVYWVGVGDGARMPFPTTPPQLSFTTT